MNIVQVGNVILSMDCLRQEFYCDLDVCHGACCVEGDAGAPLTEEEKQKIEDIVPDIMDILSYKAQEVIKKQGIAYYDQDGELVTSIVNRKDCVFTYYDKTGCCQCAIQKAQLEGRIKTDKPISCSLYPFRERHFSGGLVGLNYNKWDICFQACTKGHKLKMPVYKFLCKTLITRFGLAWYEELEKTVQSLKEKGLL